MLEFLNTLVISSDGIYGVRVIHILLLCAFGYMLPNAIRDLKEILGNE